MFFKKLLLVLAIRFSATMSRLYALTAPTFGVYGKKVPGWRGNYVGSYKSTRIALPAKITRTHLFSAANAAITVGIYASAGLTINNAVTLGTGVTTTDTSITAQPDVPRSIRAICNQASVGDGTFAAATGKWITVTGTDQFDRAITESIALNGTNAVFSVLCFKTVTQIVYPSRNAASDTCTVTGGPKLGIPTPIQQAADLVEIARKASAATAYTVETLPATTNFGNSWVWINTALPACTAGVSNAVDLVYTEANVQGATFPSVPFVVEFINEDGTEEQVLVTATSGTTTRTLTAYRGLCGGSGTLPARPDGAVINLRSSNSITPSITADDRLLLTYLTDVV